MSNEKRLGVAFADEYVEFIYSGAAPQYAKPGDSGFDLRAVSGLAPLMPGESRVVGTGLRFDIPEGCELQVRPRSGLAAKHGISVVNAPGTVDWGYTGEVKVVLINHGTEPFNIDSGDRIAQAVLAPVYMAVPVLMHDIPAKDRGDGGFGHTGSV